MNVLQVLLSVQRRVAKPRRCLSWTRTSASLASTPAPPITRLFNEVLSEVFLQHAEDVREAYYRSWRDETYFAANPFTWLSVAHVCRHWRDIALASPRLWSHVDVKREDRTKAFLRRSKRVPLTIRHFHRSNSAEAMQLIFENISRVQVLSLLIASMSSKNPLLNVSLDTPLILTELKVSAVDLDFVKSLVRPGLTRLSISTSSGNIGEWVDILSGLSALIELELAYCIIPSDAEIEEMINAPRPSRNSSPSLVCSTSVFPVTTPA